MAEAMAATGHDPWWTQYTLVVLGVATVLAVAAKWRIDRLKLLLASVEVVSRTPDIRAYRTEAVDLWRRLFAVVLVALLVQENAEHLATVGHLVGLEPLSSPLAVFAIAVVVAGVAAVGALVRLRIREIEARLAAATRLVWPRVAHASPGATAWIVAAMLLHRWLLARDDPGRAPPVVLVA